MKTRRAIAARYHELFPSVPEIQTPVQPEWARSNWQSYCIMLPEYADQRAVMQALLDVGISTRRGVHTSHMEPAYEHEPWKCAGDRSSCGCAVRRCARLPNSETARLRGLLLPMYMGMTVDEQALVVNELQATLRRLRP